MSRPQRDSSPVFPAPGNGADVATPTGFEPCVPCAGKRRGCRDPNGIRTLCYLRRETARMSRPQRDSNLVLPAPGNGADVATPTGFEPCVPCAGKRRGCRDPNGIRTRVTCVKGGCPRPLDDGVYVLRVSPEGLEPSTLGLKGRCSTAELWALFRAAQSEGFDEQMQARAAPLRREHGSYPPSGSRANKPVGPASSVNAVRPASPLSSRSAASRRGTAARRSAGRPACLEDNRGGLSAAGAAGSATRPLAAEAAPLTCHLIESSVGPTRR
jgi:hypothetical protein